MGGGDGCSSEVGGGKRWGHKGTGDEPCVGSQDADGEKDLKSYVILNMKILLKLQKITQF